MPVSPQRMTTVKTLLLGAALGAVVLSIVGFNWGGWVTGGTAEKQATERADSAVAMALAPVCVDKFRQATDAAAQLTSLQKLSPYEQRGFVEKGGWATPTGGDKPNTSVARACADSLAKLSIADLG